MANFEFDFSENIDISPDEFLENCSKTELQETFNSLITNYKFTGAPDEEDNIRSEGQRQFLYHLNILSQSWLSIIKEDAQIIGLIAKKYGAIYF